jgi:hypothetical protein
LDVDGNGWLDDNELISLAALGYGKDPTYEYLMDIKACMAPQHTTQHTDTDATGEACVWCIIWVEGLV